MNELKKKGLAISGSTRHQSANLQLIREVARLASADLEFQIFTDLASLPHFNPDVAAENIPPSVQAFRNQISAADGVLICTPEYVFSLPGSLKNALEWTVATTVFSDKPVALITASGLGEKAHESLQLILKTLGASFDENTQLLISGARSKLSSTGQLTDAPTLLKIEQLLAAFIARLSQK